MKPPFAAIVVAFLIACAPSLGQTGDNPASKYPHCYPATACAERAVPTEWPEPLSEEPLKLTFGSFVLGVQKTGLASIGYGTNLLVLRYNAGIPIVFTSETKNDLLFLRKSNLTLEEVYAVLYTKTPRDRPANAAQRKAWPKLMSVKGELLKGTNDLSVARRANLTVYFFRYAAGGPFKNYAVVSDSRHKNRSLRIESNLDFAEFESIIGTITIKE